MIPSTAAAEPGTKRRKRGRARGRNVDLNALLDVRRLLGDASREREYLIEHLHQLQDHYACLQDSHLVALAHEMRLSPAEVYEVATFYHHFDVVKGDDAAPPALTVRVCESMSCALAGSEALIDQLHTSLGAEVRVQRVPCVGRCEQAPVAVVGQNPIANATPEAVETAVASDARHAPALPDAQRLQAYVAAGGYQVYRELLAGTRDAEQIIATMESSGLRGLGGAGFPAGRKWRILRDQPSPRYLAVNIDEGEPGTFKDRHYLEQRPHQMLEGVLIACQVVGIERVWLYLRDEYPHINALLQECLQELRAAFPEAPRIELRRGAGAYICGEESAMIESIEGKRGMPRLRPPYVAQVGLFGKPTLEHNCETLHWVPEIIAKGGDWFASFGRNGRTGLRSFSVSGRVNKPGVHLAPAGITVRELIDEYCGGMQDGHELYGYFPGGASGGILPAKHDNVALDFDTLQPLGCFIGSAAVMIFSQHDRARDMALNAMRFFAHESCGQCTPCRVGTEKAAALMEQEHWDQALLEDLATVMVDASICGLGQAAPNPLRCAIQYFPEEFK